LTLLANGSFTYVPRESFEGTDSFTYTLRNGLGRSTATVKIDVGKVEGPKVEVGSGKSVRRAANQLRRGTRVRRRSFASDRP
jgi:hypothetical protein